MLAEYQDLWASLFIVPSWRIAIPFYHYLPVPDVKAFKGNIQIMKDTVRHIIDRKRKLLQEGKGSRPQFLLLNLVVPHHV